LKLASAVPDNKKGFVKYISSKRRSKENIGLILVAYALLTNRDKDKVEVFNVVVGFLPQFLIILIDLLKELGDVMAGSLSITCQRSWESGEVPTD